MGQVTPLVVTTRDACKLLAISETTLHQYASRGLITRIKFGNTTRWSLEQIRALCNVPTSTEVTV
jgi:DNA-binding transcriptional MerR regulator